MSEVKTAMQWSKARGIAVGVCQQLQPYCDALNIAGSIRRRKAYVNDIEIVCMPKTNSIADMFGIEVTVNRSALFMMEAAKLGKVLKGQPSGRYMKIELPEGINLDLFMPEPHDYARQYAIRTGSSTYSNKVIAAAWVKKGWVGTPDGLRLRGECDEKKTPDGKSIWKCTDNKPTLPPVWANEDAFFSWLDVPYLKPELRDM